MQHVGRANPHTSHENTSIAALATIKTWDDFMPESFDDCANFANIHDPHSLYPSEWKVGSNVRLREVGGMFERCFEIVLYETPIVRYYSGGGETYRESVLFTPGAVESISARRSA